MEREYFNFSIKDKIMIDYKKVSYIHYDEEEKRMIIPKDNKPQRYEDITDEDIEYAKMWSVEIGKQI